MCAGRLPRAEEMACDRVLSYPFSSSFTFVHAAPDDSAFRAAEFPFVESLRLLGTRYRDRTLYYRRAIIVPAAGHFISRPSPLSSLSIFSAVSLDLLRIFLYTTSSLVFPFFSRERKGTRRKQRDSER